MYLLNVRFRSAKSIDEARAISEASVPLFRQMSGLIEKYYVENRETGEVGGVYVWETLEQLQAYVDGPVVAAMPERFAMPEPPRLEILEVRGELTPPSDVSDARGRTIGSVRFASRLPLERMEAMSAASMGAYEQAPGLLRVFRVVEPATGRVGGVYVWADEKSRETNLTSTEFASVPQLFEVDGEVEVERLDVALALTD